MGCIKFPDGLILYTIYQNTADVMHYILYNSIEEAFKDHCNNINKKCHCEQGEKVEIFTTYGGGFFWEGKACRKCKTLISGYSPMPLEDQRGYIFYEPKNYKDGIPEATFFIILVILGGNIK